MEGSDWPYPAIYSTELGNIFSDHKFITNGVLILKLFSLLSRTAESVWGKEENILEINASHATPLLAIELGIMEFDFYLSMRVLETTRPSAKGHCHQGEN